MADIDSIIQNYLLKTPNVSFSDVENALTQLKNGLSSTDGRTSLFELAEDKEMTREELYNVLSEASGGTEVDEDAVNIFFDILNTDDSDDVLSYNELYQITGNDYKIENRNKITTYSLFHNLSSSLDEDDVEKLKEKESKASQTAENEKDEEVSSSDDEVKDESAVEEDNKTENTQTSSKSDLEIQKENIEKFINGNENDKYECPEDVINLLLEQGDIDEETASELRAQYTVYSEEDEEMINNWIETKKCFGTDITRSEAIEFLKKDGTIGEPVSTSQTPLAKQPEEDNNASETEIAEDEAETTDAKEADETDTKEQTSIDESENEEDIETDTSETDNIEANSTANYDLTDKEQAKAFVSQYIGGNLDTPAKVIDWLLETNVISEEDAELLKNAYDSSYSDKDQAKIDGLTAKGLTEEEAIAELKKQGLIDDNESQVEEQVKIPETTLSDEDVQLYASQLHDAMKGGFLGLGTDDEQFESIFNNSNFTSSDLVNIIDTYNKKYGSFIKDVEGDFSGADQDEIQKKYADILLDAYENGDENAIKLLCTEFYNGTAGKMGTSDEFIARIFEKGSDEVLAELARTYKSVTGSDIFSDIKSDFSGDTEDKYIKKLNDAISTIKD